MTQLEISCRKNAKVKKDKDLQRAYAHVRIWGTNYVSPALIKERIPSSKLKFRNKRDNVTSLQICDLIAYPSVGLSYKVTKVRLGDIAPDNAKDETKATRATFGGGSCDWRV
jgi:hypothetical protein